MTYIASRMGEDFFENWMTQVRKGLLELAILNVLCDGPLYGYEIVRRLGEADSLVITEGTVYPILSRLRSEEHVESYIEESSSGPPRKYYRLTARGRSQLRRMNEHWARMTDGISRLRKERGR